MISDESISELLARAASAVDASGIPSEFRVPAFEHACRVLTEGVTASPTTGRAESANDEISHHPGSLALADRLTKVATTLNVDPQVLGEVVAEVDDELVITLHPSRFAPAVRTAMRQIAILTVAIREAGGWDAGWTEIAAVREACRSVDLYSSKHFNAVVGGLGRYLGSSGTGDAQRLRATRETFKEAGRIVTEELALPQS